jgi:hypothetical protein
MNAKQGAIKHSFILFNCKTNSMFGLLFTIYFVKLSLGAFQDQFSFYKIHTLVHNH